MSKITMKSTKQEIMEAYEEAMRKIKESEAGKDDPVATAKAENDKKIIESADTVAEGSILNPAIIAQYNDLKAAIQMKKESLKDLYGIEAEANSLVAIVNAHKDKDIELEEKYNAKIKELNASANEKAEKLNNDIAELEQHKNDLITSTAAEYDELKKELNKQRKREEEEYEYNLKRAHQIAEDQWNDEKATREKELAEREAAVRADEAELAEKTSYIEGLEKKVEEIPALIQEATDNGIAKGKADANKSNAFEVRALEQKNDYAIKVLEDRVERVEAENTSLKAEKEKLQTKLDDAYAQMRELAAETVKSTGGVKILNGQNNAANK